MQSKGLKKPAKLVWIEAGRGIAAFLVVLYHAELMLTKYGFQPFSQEHFFEFGSRGVDFFFVLSGFIITYTHRNDLNHKREIRPYFIKRMIRLLPILWIVALPFGLAGLYLGKDTISGLVSTLLLYPSLEMPNPGVVWTLRHEVIFYILIGTCIYNLKVGLILNIIFFALVTIQLLAKPFTNSIFMMIFSAYNFEFLAGVGIAYILPTVSKLHIRHKFVLIATGLVAATLALIAGDIGGAYKPTTLSYLSSAANEWAIIFSISFGALVLGLTQLDYFAKEAPPLTHLGNSSYTLYLAHLPLLWLYTQALLYFIPYPLSEHQKALNTLFFITGCTACVVISHVAHVKIEKPLIKALRKVFL